MELRSHSPESGRIQIAIIHLRNLALTTQNLQFNLVFVVNIQFKIQLVEKGDRQNAHIGNWGSRFFRVAPR